MARKRRTLSIAEKVEIIRECDKSRKKIDVGRRYGMVSSTIRTILKNRDKIMRAYETANTKAKKLRACHKTDVDEALLKWYMERRGPDAVVSSPMLKAKAEELAAQFGYENFACSSGWIDRFKVRHSITCGKVKEKIKQDETVIKEEPVEEVTGQEATWPSVQDARDAVDVLIRFYDEKSISDAMRDSLNQIKDMTELFWKEHLKHKTSLVVTYKNEQIKPESN